jgi:hypothetical protein
VSLPQVPGNLQQERAGVLAVALELNRLGLIWRETPMADIGIDGQIEFLDRSGRAVGRLAAAQVKSGESYFRDGGTEWRVYAEEKHILYWERFPLPVILFLHSGRDGGIYWVDARQILRNPDRQSRTYIGVPKRNRLQDATAEELFATVGASARPSLSLEDVLSALATSVSGSRYFPVSYFDLFANGLTNIARSLYYGMDLITEVAEVLLDEQEFDLTVGPLEHDFLFGYVQFLVEQHLADVNMSDCLTDWLDRGNHPRFIAPLTSRGRALVNLIRQREEELVAEGRLELLPGIHIAQESFLHVQLRSSHYERIPAISRFQRLIAEL